MIDERTELSPAEIEQTNANLEFFHQFIQEYLDDPDRFDHIPSGSTLVFLTPEGEGDPEIRRANVRMAEKLIAEGRNVVVLTVGTEGVTGPVSLVSHNSTDSRE